MKEDILEQIVEDFYASQKGWFVKHNVKYRPLLDDPDYISNKDSVHSDIDIIAYNPTAEKNHKVVVVSCKSWQSGFNIGKDIEYLESTAEYNKLSTEFIPREKWKTFRELVSEKWLRSFSKKIKDETGSTHFTYIIAVTKISGKLPEENKARLETSEIIKNRFKKYGFDVKIRILTLEEMLKDINKRLEEKQTPALESTNLGRLLQLMKAANLKL